MFNSHSQLAFLSCPQCQASIAFEIWQIIDAEEHPELIEKIISGSLNSIVCTNCLKPISFIPPLLLYFPQKTPNLIFSPSSSINTLEDALQQARLLLINLENRIGKGWNNQWLKQMPPPIVRSLLPFVLEDLMNKSQTMDKSSLMDLLDQLSNAREWNEAKNLLLHNHELFNARTDLFLTAIIDTAKLRCDDEMLSRADRCKNLLSQIRSISDIAGIEDALKFFSLLQEAQKADILSEKTDDPNSFSQAKKLWAETCSSEIIGLLPFEMQQAFYNDAARCFMGSFFNAGDILDLDYAICLFEKAVEINKGTTRIMSSVMGNLGTALIARYDKSFVLADLDKAIDSLKYSLESFPEINQERKGRLYYKLAFSLKKRFQATNKIMDIEECILNFKKAITDTNKEDTEFPGYLNDLGFSLLDLYRVNGSKETLAESIEYLEKALKLGLECNNEKVSTFLSNLGIGYSELYQVSNNKEDLQKAIEYYRQAISSEEFAVDPAFYNNLATGLIDLYQINSSDDVLEEAMDLFNRAVRMAESPEDYQKWVGNLGNAYLDVFYKKNEIKYLNEAITCFEKGNHSAYAFQGVVSSFLMDRLGVGYAIRYEKSGNKEDLEEAINNFKSALEATPEGSPDYIRFASNLAQALNNRSSFGSIDDLTQAIEIELKVINIAVPGSLARIDCLGHLGMLLIDRYEQSGQLNDLVEAKKLLKEVLSKTPSTSVYFPERENSLAIALLREGEQTRNLNLIEEAIDLFKNSLDLETKNSKQYPAILLNLAVAYSEKYDITHDIQDLTKSIESYTNAKNEFMPSEIGYRTLLNNLANALLSKYKLSENETDLDLVISYLDKALNSTSVDSPDYSLFQNNLANALRLKSSNKDQNLISKAISCYEAACKSNGTPRNIFLASRTWGDWAFSRHCWNEAINAYMYGIEVLEELILLQPFWKQKQVWMAEGKEIYLNAAYVLSKAGRYEEAITLLERNRARQISEFSLKNSMIQLEIKNPELVIAYKQIAQQYSDLQDDYIDYLDNKQLINLSPGKVHRDWNREFIHINSQFAKIRELISRLDEFSWINLSHADLDIFSTQPDPIVYLAPAKYGGMALIVKRDDIIPVWLNDLNTQDTVERVNRYLPNYRRWTMSRMIQIMEEEIRESWFREYEEISEWVGRCVIFPVIKKIEASSTSKITLIPMGPLVMLPLHASYVEDAGSHIKNHALDNFVITYASSVRAFVKYKSKNMDHIRSFLFIDNPDGSLTFSDFPIQVATKYISHSTILRGEQASYQEVIERIIDNQCIHFSTHGFADLANPLLSGVKLADGDFNIIHSLNIEGSKPTLVILSACETGIPGTILPDELMSLPGALMETGTEGTISSFWAVDELSTAFVLGKFYKLWLEDKLTIGEALQGAQIWLRDSCNAELQNFADSIDPGFKEKHPREAEIFDLNPEGHYFDLPFYWAPFYYTGV